MILKTTLKKLRLRKHITQKELAEMCGISQGTIGDIERGANAFVWEFCFSIPVLQFSTIGT